MKKNVVNSVLLGILVLTTCFGGYFQSNWNISDDSEQITVLSPENHDESNLNRQTVTLTPKSAATTKDWTFMVYLDADNNLVS